MTQFPTEESDVLEPADALSETPTEAVTEAVTETRTVSDRASLTIKRGGIETDIVFEFAAPAIIGRFDPSVGPIDIDLGDIEEGSYVSRKHARITRDEDGWKIEDLGSSNGTFLLRTDFEKIESAPLTEGDEIALGNARMIFREVQAEPSEA